MSSSPDKQSKQPETGLPAGWEVRHSNSKNLPYYFNQAEKISRWEPPAGADTEKLKQYMATYHTKPLVAEDSHPGKIRAAHLLVKHKDSRRPASWKEVSPMALPPPPSPPFFSPLFANLRLLAS